MGSVKYFMCKIEKTNERDVSSIYYNHKQDKRRDTESLRKWTQAICRG